MKTQIMLVMAAMLVTVFVVPVATPLLLVNVGILATLLTSLNSLAGMAVSLHFENKWRVHSKNIVVKDTDGKYLAKAS